MYVPCPHNRTGAEKVAVNQPRSLVAAEGDDFAVFLGGSKWSFTRLDFTSLLKLLCWVSNCKGAAESNLIYFIVITVRRKIPSYPVGCMQKTFWLS